MLIEQGTCPTCAQRVKNCFALAPLAVRIKTVLLAASRIRVTAAHNHAVIRIADMTSGLEAYPWGKSVLLARSLLFTVQEERGGKWCTCLGANVTTFAPACE